MGRGRLGRFSHSNGRWPCSFSILPTSPSQPMISRPERPGTSTILILIVPGRSILSMCVFRRLKRSGFPHPPPTIAFGLWKSAEEASETRRTQKLLIEWTLRATTGLHHPSLKLKKKERKNDVPLDNLASSAQGSFQHPRGHSPASCVHRASHYHPHPSPSRHQDIHLGNRGLSHPTSLSASELRIRT